MCVTVSSVTAFTLELRPAVDLPSQRTGLPQLAAVSSLSQPPSRILPRILSLLLTNVNLWVITYRSCSHRVN